MKIPGHNRNEALDCRNYALAGFKIIDPDTLAVERRLKDLPANNTPTKAAATPKARRVNNTASKIFDEW